MAKKIEGVISGAQNGPGYELGNGAGFCDFWEGSDRKLGEGGMSATLILHDGPPERVFTESEVRAMLRDLIEDQALCDVHNGWQSGMIPDFAGIASKHGVSLDPA